jgi:4-amino-4-deoxy-L-arabinose transferase-like glycosyltransferase
LSIILIVAVLLRLAAALYLGNTVEVLPGTFDQVSYHTLALRVLDGHGFSFGQPSWPMTAANAPTAHWSYLYTLYLTAVYALFGPNPLIARIIQAVIVGLLQPYLAYLLGKHIFGERAGLLAAAFTAVYIYFIYYAATLMTEPFYVTAILGALYLLLRLRRPAPGSETRLAVTLGLALGTAILLRQLFLLFVPFLLLWLWVVRWRDARLPGEHLTTARFIHGGSLPWRPALVVAGIIALMILPFTLYNQSRFDRFVLLNTNAGFAFFWANHPVYGARFQGILPPELGSYQDLIPTELRHLDEPALEQALMERGLQFITDDPGRYLLLSLSRIPVYFMFWPSADSGTVSNISRVGSFALFLPLMLGGLVYSLASARLRRSTFPDTSLLLLFMLLYTGVHLASWALIRYRLPVDAVLLLYAGLAAAVLWAIWERRSGRQPVYTADTTVHS